MPATSATDLVSLFYLRYLQQRDREGALALLTEDVLWTGTGAEETVCGKEAVRALVLEEMRQDPAPWHVTIDSQQAAAGPVVMLGMTLRSGYSAFPTRATCALREDGAHGLRICALHTSLPTPLQRQGEISPRPMLDEQINSLKSEMLDEYVSGGVACCFAEPHFPFESVNKHFANLLGYADVQELLRATHGNFLECVHPEEREMLIRTVQEQLEHQQGYSVEYRALCKGGGTIWLQDVGRLAPPAQGRQRVTCLILDITDKKNALDRLEEANKQLANIVNSIPGGVAIYKLTPQRVETLYFSDGIPALSGHTVEEYRELIKGDAADMVYAGDKERLLQEIQDAMEHDTLVDISFRKQQVSGGLQWVHLQGRKIREEDGCPVMHAVFYNISRQTELYQTILDETDTGIFVRDANTFELLYANERMFAIAGKEPRACMGQPCHSLLLDQPAPCKACIMQTLREQDSTLESEIFQPLLNKWLNGKVHRINWRGRDAVIAYIQDISREHAAQQRLAEQRDALEKTMTALTEAKNRLSAALSNTGVSMWEYDPTAGRLTQNDESRNIHGPERVLENVPESLITSGLVAQESAEDCRVLYAAAAAGISRISRDVRMRTGSTEDYHWERLFYIPVFDARGRHIKSIGTAIDVTEQKLAEQKFHETTTMLEMSSRTALNTLVLNLSRNLVVSEHVNTPDTPRHLGRTADEFFADVQAGMTGEESQRLCRKYFSRKKLLLRYAAGERELKLELRGTPAGQDVRWAQVTVSMCPHPTSGDITAFVRAQDIQHEKTMQAVMANLVKRGYDFIVGIDTRRDHYVMFANTDVKTPIPATEGGDFEKAVDFTCHDFVYPPDVDMCIRNMKLAHLTAMLATQEKYEFIVRVVEPGCAISIKKQHFSWLDKENGIILHYRTDITAALRHEQRKKDELTRALRAAKAASSAKSDFLSRMSHDIRTPMNAILGMISLMEDMPASPELHACLNNIQSASSYLLELINDTLDMSKIEQKKFALSLAPLSPEMFWNAFLPLVREQARLKGVTFVADKGNMRHGYAMLDRQRLSQIFVNLISNAIKFTPKGGTVRFTAEVLHRAPTLVQMRFTVQDTGCGISPAFLPHLFEPFEQENSTRIGELQGSGLGLAIVKNLVALMHGSISVESEQGKGATFTVLLPFPLATPEDLRHCQTALPESAHLRLEGRRVLLAEDHPMNVLVASKMLECMGVQVEHAADGAKAVACFTASPEHWFDAVLMDIRMPMMDGLAATRALRALPRADALSVPIIAMTANAFDEDARLSREAGMNDHLVKPISPDTLRASLCDAIACRPDWKDEAQEPSA